MHVLIAGVSTRAAAESAAKAGFEVTAIDAFGDLDQHPSVRSLTRPHDATGFTAHAAAQMARSVVCDAVAYLSPFENHPRAVDDLAARGTLWGNPPDVLRRVRDPFLVAGALRRLGFATPITRVDVTSEVREWLVKPFRSGGGQAIRPWSAGTPVTAGLYVQERIDGIPGSIAFVAAGGRAVPLGVTRQLIGETVFGTQGYRYCGNVLASVDDTVLSDRVVDTAIELANQATREFGLRGLNGIDFVVRDEVPYAIEINPRWSSSMELVERAYGVSVFGAHAAACVEGALPAFDLSAARQSRSVLGKAIVFARERATAPDTRTWLDDPTVRDVPRPGERLEPGHPVCTVLATGRNAAECYDALVRRAADLYAAIEKNP